MEVYKFSLQRLLDIRDEQEKYSKIKFKEAKTEKEMVEQKLEILKQKYFKFASNINIGTTADKKLTWFYLDGISEGIQKSNQELIYKDKVLEERRADLKDKKIKNKTVEILKQKDYSRYLTFERLQEQKENDEFAISGFIRRMQEVNK